MGSSPRTLLCSLAIMTTALSSLTLRPASAARDDARTTRRPMGVVLHDVSTAVLGDKKVKVVVRPLRGAHPQVPLEVHTNLYVAGSKPLVVTVPARHAVGLARSLERVEAVVREKMQLATWEHFTFGIKLAPSVKLPRLAAMTPDLGSGDIFAVMEWAHAEAIRRPNGRETGITRAEILRAVGHVRDQKARAAPAAPAE